MLGELNPCGGGDPIPLLRPRLIVGRQSRCDIALRFDNVSSTHCELELTNGYWYVRDLGSRNGIKVNGTRCDTHWLMPGDVLSVAKHRYEINYTPNGAAPPPEEENPFAQGLLEKAGLGGRRNDDTVRRPKPDLMDSVRPKNSPKPKEDDDLDDDDLIWLDDDKSN